MANLPDPSRSVRRMLYRGDAQLIVDTEDALAQAERAGWLRYPPGSTLNPVAVDDVFCQVAIGPGGDDAVPVVMSGDGSPESVYAPPLLTPAPVPVAPEPAKHGPRGPYRRRKDGTK